MDRLAKLELGLKAAIKLRKAIELPPKDHAVKALLVPLAAVQQFDKTIQEIKDNDNETSGN